MKSLVIGEPCIDVIHKADGRILREPGGISYSVVAAGVIANGIEILPSIGIHPEDKDYFIQLFDRLPSVNKRGIYDSKDRTRKVDLFYQDENSRWECSTQPITPTPFEKIEPFLPADGIHINLISGSDLTLDTFRRLRNGSKSARIHLDLHNIVMEHLPDTRRVRRPVPEYLDWCSLADTVQLNEEEASVIDAATSDADAIASKVLDSGPKGLVITLAEKGALLFTREGGELKKDFVEARRTSVVDPTGSGDVFGAAFLHEVVLGKDLHESARTATAMAAMKVATAGPAAMTEWNLAEINER